MDKEKTIAALALMWGSGYRGPINFDHLEQRGLEKKWVPICPNCAKVRKVAELTKCTPTYKPPTKGEYLKGAAK